MLKSEFKSSLLRLKVTLCHFLVPTFVGYLMPNLFYRNYQFYFKQFSLACVYSSIVKNIYIPSNSIL